MSDLTQNDDEAKKPLHVEGVSPKSLKLDRPAEAYTTEQVGRKQQAIEAARQGRGAH